MIKNVKAFFLTIISVALALGAASAAELSTVVLPENVEVIEAEAFMNDPSLERIVVPAGTLQILDRAFAGSGLLEAELSSSVEYIAENAFDGCLDLILLAPVGSYAESWAERKGFVSGEHGTPASDFTYSIQNGECTIQAYNGSDAEVEIPARIEGCYVTVIASNAFKGKTELTRVRLPAGLQSIGNYAFSGCTSLTEANIPNHVETIGNYAFNGCTLLSNLALPVGLTIIGNYSFSNCDSLTAVKVPSSVTSIGGYAYSGCDNLRSITLNEGLTTIGSNAFANCTSLESMKVPDSVTSLGSNFILGDLALTYLKFGGGVPKLTYSQTRLNKSTSDSPALETLVIGEGVTELGQSVFSAYYSTGNTYENYYYPNLKTVSLPETLTIIGGEAFEKCTSLESIHLPSHVSSIGVSAFAGCTSLTEINIPDTVKTIGNFAFDGCALLRNMTLPEGLTTIGYSAFRNCDSLTAVEVPSSVTSIGQSAYNGCDSLKSITLNEGLITIGSSAFADCISLESMKVPDSVTSLGSSFVLGDLALTYLEFGGGVPKLTYSLTRLNKSTSARPALETLVIGEGVTELGQSAFSAYYSTGNTYENYYYPNLKTISLPKTLTTIGYEAFNGASSLTAVTIPENVKSIGAGAFRNCQQLVSVVWPERIIVIPSHVFQNCHSLTTINLPNKLEHVCGHAFDQCTSLTGIDFSRLTSLWKIDEYAFNECDSLTRVSLPNVQIIGSHAFYGCDALSSMTLSDTMTMEIGSYAFAECTSLGSLTIPASVMTVGNHIISGDISMTSLSIEGGKTVSKDKYAVGKAEEISLSSIYMGGNITRIESNAFSNCTNLYSVYLPPRLQYIGSSAFSGCENIYGFLSLPDTLTTLGSSAFSGCDNWVAGQVVIPYQVTNLNAGVFKDCSWLSSIVLSRRIEFISSTWYSGTESVELIVPEPSYASEWCAKNHKDTSKWNYRTYSDDSAYYPVTSGYCDSAVTNVTVTSETHEQYHPYTVSFTVDGVIEGVNMYVMRESAQRAYLGRFTSSTEGVTVSQSGDTYTWTISFSPEASGVLGDNFSVKLRLETVAVDGFATGVYTDSTSFVITPTECVDPEIVLTVGNSVLVDYKTTMIDLQLSIKAPDWVTDSSSVVCKYVENPFVMIEMPGGISSCLFASGNGGFASSRNEDGNYVLNFTSLSNSYGTQTVTCTLGYNLPDDLYGGYFSELLGFTVNSDNGYGCEQTIYQVNFPEGIADKTEEEIKALYLGKLKNSDGDINDKYIQAVLYYRIVSNYGENIIYGPPFALMVIDCLKEAPALYRNLFLYSFFDYNIQGVTSGSQHEGETNTLKFRTFNSEYDIEKNGLRYLTTFFHEAGHAIDFNAENKAKYYTDARHKQDIYTKLRQDAEDWLSTSMESFKQENGASITNQEAGKIINAILNYKNKDTVYQGSDGGLYPSSYEEIEGHIIVQKPEGLNDEYISDYNAFVEYCMMKLASLVYSPKTAGIRIKDGLGDACLVSDLMGGVTNNAVHGFSGVHYNSQYPNYWFSTIGTVKNHMVTEVWSNFFASQILRNRYGFVHTINESVFPTLVPYASKLADQMWNIYQNR